MSPEPGRAGEKEEIQLPDEQLVRDCLKGRDAAWSALIRSYKNLIFSIPIRHGFSQEDSADIFQAVCMDLSGRELSEKITRIHPETKVIFMSGYSNNLLSDQQVLDPKHELVQKPFRLTTLGRRIREILTGGLAAGAGK
jgi:hypothetical protein